MSHHPVAESRWYMGQTLREAPPFNLHGLWLGSPIDPPELPEPSVEDWWSVQPPLNGPDMQGRTPQQGRGETRPGLWPSPWVDGLGQTTLYGEVGGPGCSFRSCQPLEVFNAKAIEEKCFKKQPAWEKPHSWHSVWGSGEQVPMKSI